MISINKKAYSIQKYGNHPRENEDAWAIYQSLKNEEVRLAIADGASQTTFSTLWAKLLVNQSVRFSPSIKRLFDVAALSRDAWSREISAYDLSWNFQERVKKGSFATLLWLSVSRYPGSMGLSGRLKALAIGDSNLFVVRRNRVRWAFPINRSEDFGNSPILLSSIPANNSQIHSFIRSANRNWYLGDELFLATDALAKYLLLQLEADRNPFPELRDRLLTTEDHNLALDEWVKSLRDQGEMKDDDTTLVWLGLTRN